MPASYSLRQDIDGWTVFVVATGEPAQFRGIPMRNMKQEHAEKLVAMLNRPVAVQPSRRLQ
ncbi:hypothetical protein [Ancylobacter terrae]|uniref:hypothetical protein n=1 Tax=Ancylobacter sp. sgz301288 TaxID=3342077 RepID=UPI0038591362